MVEGVAQVVTDREQTLPHRCQYSPQGGMVLLGTKQDSYNMVFHNNTLHVVFIESVNHLYIFLCVKFGGDYDLNARMLISFCV